MLPAARGIGRSALAPQTTGVVTPNSWAVTEAQNQLWRRIVDSDQVVRLHGDAP